MIECGEAGKLIERHYEGGLEPGEKVLLDEHISCCAVCARAFAGIGAVESALAEALKPMQVPAAIDRPGKFCERKRPPLEFILSPSFALACALVLLLAFGYRMSSEPEKTYGPPAHVSDAGNPTSKTDYSLVVLKGAVYFKKNIESAETRIADSLEGLVAGNVIVAEKDGEAELIYQKDSSLKIRPDTSVEITDTGLRIKNGSVWVNYKKTGRKYIFNTPAAVIAIKGTIFSIEVDKNGSAAVSVDEGLVSVENEAGSVDVGPGERAVAETGKAPSKISSPSGEDKYIKLK